MAGTFDYRSNALDGLRGIAATSVIFYHAILLHGVLVDTVLVPPIQSLGSPSDIAIKIALTLFNGHSAVLLFFVLSGFVLRMSLERATGPAHVVVTNFVLRRVLRLYPALMFCMACFLGVAAVCATVGWHGFPVLDIRLVLLNASLFDITVHGPSRTIQGEMLAVPFLLLAFYVAKKFGTSGMLGCLAFSMFAFETPALVFWAPNMDAWLPAFFFGMVAADHRLRPYFAEATGSALILLALLFVFLRMFVHMNAVSGSLAQMVLCAALVGSVYYADPKFAIIRFLRMKPILFLGRISYSLYLLNVLWLIVLSSIVSPTGLQGQYPVVIGLLLGLVITALTIPLAIFSERVFEQGGIRLGRFFSLASTAPEQPAVKLAPAE